MFVFSSPSVKSTGRIAFRIFGTSSSSRAAKCARSILPALRYVSSSTSRSSTPNVAGSHAADSAARSAGVAAVKSTNLQGVEPYHCIG
jgi:hypothetical protein